ncbi:MAG: hypothetical protein JNM07_08985 [Phycisphaerae bacterium]|nr:hypothetical protein [Phycisphaerae bacterium]
MARPDPESLPRHPSLHIAPGESYVIRRQVLKLFGAAFHIYDPSGRLVGYCKQRAFKLKEDIRIYTDESCSQELVVIRARNIIDFSGTYEVALADGSLIGSLRRSGMASNFLRDSWQLFDAGGRPIGTLKEQGGILAFARRYIEYVAFFAPERFSLTRTDGAEIAAFRQHFNPFVYRLSVTVKLADPEIDDLLILATGCLITAIEGRQS